MSYNIQGWLSSKSSAKSGTNLFSMNLLYYNSSRATNKYNGNIVEWQWTQGAGSQNSYALTYDKLDRLTNSNRYEGGAATNAFTEKNLTYDRNGNITQLQRYGSTGTLQDNFTYNYNGTTYNGNQLSSISGSVSATYAYDNNGNMTSDGRKNLAITYNVLNLQQTLSQSGTAVANYSWLADGTKCAVTADNASSGFDYLGSLKYTRNGSTRTLESTDFGGGRVVYSGGVYTRYYYTTDHLGSVRVITNSSGAIVEQNDYYPFGGKHANANYPQFSVNKQKFNGKELQTTGNTGFLDYGARMYDDAVGRWSVVDPLGEKYKGLSPYNYCENNSISLIDSDGKSSTEAVEQDQKKNNEGPNWFQQAFATTLLSIINTAKLYGDNKTGNQTETEKLAAGFNLFTSVVFAIQGGFEMMKPSNSMSKSGNLAGYTDDAVSTEVASETTRKGSQTVYRVFGGDAKALGKSWTPVNPGSVANYRDVAGLPNVNTGQFIIEGKVQNSNILLQRSALSANGNVGGIMEYVVKDPEKIKINGVWGVNPPF